MQIRTYLLIDQMQPQYGALTGKTMQGEIPVEGMAEIYIETAPASDIYKVMDIALKTTNVRAGALAVEREYGSLEIHSSHQESVLEADLGGCPLEADGDPAVGLGTPPRACQTRVVPVRTRDETQSENRQQSRS